MDLKDFDRLHPEALDLLDIDLSEGEMSALGRYASELMAWNERTNLTAIREIAAIRRKHFLDSLSCNQIVTGGRLIVCMASLTNRRPGQNSFSGVKLPVLAFLCHLQFSGSLTRVTP